jgi:hypothetical protein
MVVRNVKGFWYPLGVFLGAVWGGSGLLLLAGVGTCVYTPPSGFRRKILPLVGVVFLLKASLAMVLVLNLWPEKAISSETSPSNVDDQFMDHLMLWAIKGGLAVYVVHDLMVSILIGVVIWQKRTHLRNLLENKTMALVL